MTKYSVYKITVTQAKKSVILLFQVEADKYYYSASHSVEFTKKDPDGNWISVSTARLPEYYVVSQKPL